jgi:hypothetical protein
MNNSKFQGCFTLRNAIDNTKIHKERLIYNFFKNNSELIPFFLIKLREILIYTQVSSSLNPAPHDFQNLLINYRIKEISLKTLFNISTNEGMFTFLLPEWLLNKHLQNAYPNNINDICQQMLFHLNLQDKYSIQNISIKQLLFKIYSKERRIKNMVIKALKDMEAPKELYVFLILLYKYVILSADYLFKIPIPYNRKCPYTLNDILITDFPLSLIDFSLNHGLWKVKSISLNYFSTVKIDDYRDLSNRLTSLNLSSSLFGDIAILNFCNFITRNTSITCLDLSWNLINDRGAFYFSQSLLKNDTLQIVSLRSNKIKSHGFKSICKSFEKNQTIYDFDCSLNHIEIDGSRYFASVIKRNSVLSKLDIKSNELKSIGALYIFSALKHNNIISTIDLRCNGIDSEYVNIISKVLRRNLSIKKIWLTANNIRVHDQWELKEVCKFIFIEISL